MVRKKKDPPPPRKRGDWLEIYRAKVEALKVAEVLLFNPIEYGVDLADRDSFRASIASYARRFHAGGKTICSFNHANGMVELRRVS
jgi:hypothetical protein